MTGKMEPGPSEAYMRLLRGEINVKEYVSDLQRRVDQIGSTRPKRRWWWRDRARQP